MGGWDGKAQQNELHSIISFTLQMLSPLPYTSIYSSIHLTHTIILTRWSGVVQLDLLVVPLETFDEDGQDPRFYQIIDGRVSVTGE